jgi:hypothetical protein
LSFQGVLVFDYDSEVGVVDVWLYFFCLEADIPMLQRDARVGRLLLPYKRWN